MADQKAMAHAQAVKEKYEEQLLNRPNVLGVGVGLRQRGGVFTDEVCIVVSVKNKKAPGDLEAEALLPTEIEGVPVDVLEVGEIGGK